MSRRTRSALGAVAAAVVAGTSAVAVGVSAQEVDRLPSEEELLRRIEELRPMLEEAVSAAAAARSAVQARVAAEQASREIESFQVGTVRVLALPDQADLARELFEQVLRDDFGDVFGSPALHRTVFTFQWAWERPTRIYVDLDALEADAVRRVELTRFWAPTTAVARARVRDAVWAVLLSELPVDQPLRAWLRTTRYPLGSRAARALALQPGGAHRPCLAGDTRGCLRALGLVGAPAPVPIEIPPLLFLEAVRLGGGGAWSRVLERVDAEPLDVLTHAAGADESALVDAWRVSLEARRPEAHAGLGATTGAVLLWALALGALALRSTRWRLT